MEKEDSIENKNENENINSNIEESNSYDLSEEKIKPKIKSKKISIGSSILHILPLKLNDDNECQRKSVDKLFEKYIGKDTEDNYKDYDTTLFRGRILNGKKINIEKNNKFKINYVNLNKENEDNNDEYKISINRKVNEYYVWKYDQSIENDNNLMLLEKNIKKLDVLS